MKKVLITCAAAGLLIAGGSASAAAVMAPAPAFNPWYIGVGVNHTSGIDEEYELTLGGTKNTLELDSSKIGWNIFAGYDLTKHFGTELGFSYVGDRKYKLTPASATTDTFTYKVDGWVVYLDGMMYMPFNEYFKVFAKLGANYLRVTGKLPLDFIAANTKVDTTLSAFGMNFGGGLQFSYNQFGIRLSYTDYQSLTQLQRTAHLVPNLLGLDIMYHFG